MFRPREKKGSRKEKKKARRGVVEVVSGRKNPISVPKDKGKKSTTQQRRGENKKKKNDLLGQKVTCGKCGRREGEKATRRTRIEKKRQNRGKILSGLVHKKGKRREGLKERKDKLPRCFRGGRKGSRGREQRREKRYIHVCALRKKIRGSRNGGGQTDGNKRKHPKKKGKRKKEAERGAVMSVALLLKRGRYKNDHPCVFCFTTN